MFIPVISQYISLAAGTFSQGVSNELSDVDYLLRKAADDESCDERVPFRVLHPTLAMDSSDSNTRAHIGVAEELTLGRICGADYHQMVEVFVAGQ